MIESVSSPALPRSRMSSSLVNDSITADASGAVRSSTSSPDRMSARPRPESDSVSASSADDTSSLLALASVERRAIVIGSAFQKRIASMVASSVMIWLEYVINCALARLVFRYTDRPFGLHGDIVKMSLLYDLYHTLLDELEHREERDDHTHFVRLASRTRKLTE